MNEITSQSSETNPALIYKPSEIIGIFNSILAKQSVNAQVVYLRGVYLASGRQSYNGFYYDTLRDEDRQEEITMYVTQQQRENLKNGNLVNVGGVLGRNVNNRGQIQIVLNGLYRFCPWIAHAKTVSHISSCNGTLFKITV